MELAAFVMLAAQRGVLAVVAVDWHIPIIFQLFQATPTAWWLALLLEIAVLTAQQLKHLALLGLAAVD